MRKRVGAAVLIVCSAAMLQSQSRPLVAPAAAPIYARLLPQIETIKLFDHHAHPALPDDPDVDIAPPPPGGTPLRMRDDNPETSAAARALFGFPFGFMKGAHGRWLVDKKSALKKQYAGARYFNEMLDRLGIETSMANRVAMAPYLDPARFKWVFFVDCYMFPFDNSSLAARNTDEAVYMPLQTKLRRQYERALGLDGLPATFDGYLSFVSRSLGANQSGGGDYFNLRGVNVLNLENVLRDPRYATTTFVLIHGGYPFDREAILLASKKNVYLDSSATELILYPTEFKTVLKHWLETFPERVTFGTDAYPYNAALGVEEVYWMGAHTSRTALAAALAEMIAAREITEVQALPMARAYLHDTAAALYK